MINKVAYGAAGLAVSGLLTLGVAFAQTTSPSPSPSATPSASTTTVPSAPPSTGMGGI
ncbi:MAG: hypothetical protein SGJ02_11830 [bacterium]|nr:hypothetical protein [bacterium]